MMPIKLIALCLFLCVLSSLSAAEGDIEIVDTLYAELSLTNSIFHNIESDTYLYYPHYNSLEISYGRSSIVGPGMIEGRGVASFQIDPVPLGYHIQSVEFQSYCCWYWDNSDDTVWPHYYSTPYQVMIDHIQFDTILPEVFGQNTLSPNVAVLQDSAYIGWVGTDVTGSYLDDLQQSRTFSQYRLHFPPGYDVVGSEVDLADYARGPGYPRLRVSYRKDVSNSDEISQPISNMIKGLYPMPVHGVLNIEIEERYRSTVSIYLYDLKGRIINVYDGIRFNQYPVQINLPDCSSGIYFLKVKAGEKSEIRRITIIK